MKFWIVYGVHLMECLFTSIFGIMAQRMGYFELARALAITIIAIVFLIFCISVYERNIAASSSLIDRELC